MTPKHIPECLINTNGINVNFDSFGNEDAPVIILIMGLATQMIFWETKFCELLASKGFRVIRFDNRDVGKSTWCDDLNVPSHLALLANILLKRTLKAPYSLNDMAKDTLGLMDGLQIDQAHVVGASMGGMIAQALAIRSPERVKSLTSIMSTTGNRQLPKPKITFLSNLFKRPPKQADQFVAFGLSLWKALHGNTYGFQKEKVSELLRLSVHRGLNPKSNVRQLAAILSSKDRTEALKAVKIPSLILHGDSDPLIPVACGHATAQAIPHSKIKVYSGMGHTLPDELLPEIANDILELIGGTS
ncbi:alpha/beta hydrolase [Paraglaciecola sp.]|uniref:alpha/beta fold hydrolase n=1 Tax=Paraglaciecola sp. TaxID=1920173 RepID=UPI003266D6D8